MGTSVGQTSKLLKDCLMRTVTDSSIVMGPPSSRQDRAGRLEQRERAGLDPGPGRRVYADFRPG